MSVLLENLLHNRLAKLKQIQELKDALLKVESEIVREACPFTLGQLCHFHDDDANIFTFMVCKINFTETPPFYEIWCSRQIITPTKGKHFQSSIEKIMRPELLIGIANFQPEFSEEFQKRFHKYRQRNYFPAHPPIPETLELPAYDMYG